MTPMKRILSTLFLFIALLYLPWWLLLPISIFLIFLFPWYVEIIVLAAIFDVVVGIYSVTFLGLPMVAFLTITILFFSIEHIKKNLR